MNLLAIVFLVLMLALALLNMGGSEGGKWRGHAGWLIPLALFAILGYLQFKNAFHT